MISRARRYREWIPWLIYVKHFDHAMRVLLTAYEGLDGEGLFI
jgi:hypothetical protein